MRGAPDDVAPLLARIAAVRPDLAGVPHAILAEGWDSVAIDVGDAWIFKFPRSSLARTSLLAEEAFLTVIAPRVRMAVPRLVIHDREGEPFSQHRKIAGEHLLAPGYRRLDETQRERLARRLAELYADLHAIPLSVMADAGAGPVEADPGPEWLEERAVQLPMHLRAYLAGVVSRWRAEQARPRDLVFGQFDGHGWNMAFDHRAGVLNGIYDFADAGIGERHRDFASTNWIDPDLTRRIIAHYQVSTGIAVDRRRVDLYTAVLRLREHLGGDEIPGSLATLEAWAAYEAGEA